MPRVVRVHRPGIPAERRSVAATADGWRRARAAATSTAADKAGEGDDCSSAEGCAHTLTRSGLYRLFLEWTPGVTKHTRAALEFGPFCGVEPLQVGSQPEDHANCKHQQRHAERTCRAA